jgi:hypothetical protein
MASWWSMPEMSPWKPPGLTFPPNSARAWIRLAVWELWMGMLLCIVVGFGIFLIVTAPTHLVIMRDFSACYAVPPVLPCDRIAYQSGTLNVVFTALFGALLIGVAAWLLWELWSAVEPKPITDDFLRLLNNSFGRNWRNPLTWPWARLLWAYGFTAVGVAVAGGIGVTIWALVAASGSFVPSVDVDTSQSFRLGR